MQPQPQGKQIPIKQEHKIKLIVSKDYKKYEEENNEFMATVGPKRTVKNVTTMLNQKTGEYVSIIHYSDLFPYTKEEWVKNLKIQDEFAKPFKEINNVMPEGMKVEDLGK